MNRLFLVGNITSDIHFDVLGGRPFLRLILMSSRPRVIQGLRIVLWDERAKEFYPCLKKGSEIGVLGYLTTRQFKGKIIIEVEAAHLILLRNINWEDGGVNLCNQLLPPLANSYFAVGAVGEDIYFDWRPRTSSSNVENMKSNRYAFLRLLISNGNYIDHLRVVTYGSLAELAYPYLQPGSIIAVDGHLQTKDEMKGQKAVEVTAEHMAFLQNINWAAGTAYQKRLMEIEDI